MPDPDVEGDKNKPAARLDEFSDSDLETAQEKLILSIPERAIIDLTVAESFRENQPQQDAQNEIEISSQIQRQVQKVFSPSKQNRGWIIARVADVLSILNRWL